VVVRGLAGSGVSFRSVSNPKLYIRHRNFVLYASANDNSALFKKCATFNVRYGVGAGNGRFGISFESINFPGYFITVVGMRLKIVKMSTALKKAATWTPVTAQVKVTHTTQTVTQHTTQTVSCGFTCKYGHQKGRKIAHSKETTRPNCAKKCCMHKGCVGFDYDMATKDCSLSATPWSKVAPTGGSKTKITCQRGQQVTAKIVQPKVAALRGRFGDEQEDEPEALANAEVISDDDVPINDEYVYKDAPETTE